MKKYILFILMGLLLVSPIQTFAQTSEEPTEPVSVVGENEAQVNFQALGYDDEELFSPYDAMRIRFGTPPNWELTNGAEVTLEYDVFIGGSDVDVISEDLSGFTGMLVVIFNDFIIENVYIEGTGSHSVTIQIPAEALTSTRADRRHELEIFLSASLSCVYDIHTNVVIKSASSFILPFKITPPELDLSNLPYPFYSRDSLLPDTTFLVVPNDPDSGELQAAINVASGFGSMTGEDFHLELVSIGQLTEENLRSGNLIFVGLPAHFDLLSDIQFPLMVSNGSFVDMPESAAEDGVVQLAYSPWDQNKVVMLISGNTIDAVNKAAMAVSTGEIFTNPDPRLVFVASINPYTDSLPIVEEFSLKDLGYETETISDIGSNQMVYSFYISKEQVTSENAYFDLIFSHSGLLDYNASTLAVKLNGETIASSGLTDESVNLTTLRVDFPPGLLRYGENRLSVMVNLLPFTSCDATGFSEYWITILENSMFHIPVGPPLNDQAVEQVDFQMYPNLFLSYSNLSDVAFILPNSDPNAWRAAAEIAFKFGDLVNPPISDIKVAYGNDIAPNVLDEQSLILVGLPNELPIFTEINDSLPAPFDLDTNTATEQSLLVSYRIPPDVNLGYLELLPSIYNPQNLIMVVAGNSDGGVILAENALTDNSLIRQLTGDFAITNGTQIASSSVVSPLGTNVGQSSIVDEVVPEAEEVVVTQLPPALPTSTSTFEKPSWLVPVLSALIIILILIVGYILVRTLIRSRSSRVDI